MESQELEKLVAKLYNKFKGAPGVDLDFIRKCLISINALGDPEIEAKIFHLISLVK
jgi:hypothetical protein